MKQKVWIVTGGSKGIGRELVRSLLDNGQNVITTSRNKYNLIKQFGDENEAFLPVSLSLTNEKEIDQVIQMGLKKFKRIDVLVNNAGYMRAGALEEVTDSEVRDCFDVNFFGTVNMIRSILPIMRAQNSGHIINTSSVASVRAGAFQSAYSASKSAVNGISLSLVNELQPFNIKVTNVLPGFIRSDFLENTSYQLNVDNNSPYIEGYKESLGFIQQMNKSQQGDPKKVAVLYQKLVLEENPPTELMIGSDAYQIMMTAANETLNLTKKSKSDSFSTDY